PKLRPRVEIPMFVHAMQSWLGRTAIAASALATLAFIVVGAPRSAAAQYAYPAAAYYPYYPYYAYNPDCAYYPYYYPYCGYPYYGVAVGLGWGGWWGGRPWDWGHGGWNHGGGGH